MSVFTVDLKNQPGELARLCEAMAGRGVNLILSATSRGEDGTVAFIVDDEARAETALADAGIGYARHPRAWGNLHVPSARGGITRQARVMRTAGTSERALAFVRHADRNGRAAGSGRPHGQAPAAARRSHPRCGKPPPRLRTRSRRT